MSNALGEMLLYITICSIQYFILIFIMQYVCSARMNLNRKNLLICICISVICHFLAHLTKSWSIEFFSMFFLIGVTVLLFSSKKVRDLFLFFPALALYTVLTVMPETILQELCPSMEGRIILYGVQLEYASLATDAALLIILLILRHILMKYETLVPFSAKEVIGSIGLLLFSLVDILLVMTLNHAVLLPWQYYLWAIVFVGAFVLTVGYYLYNLIDTRIRIYRQTLTISDTEYLQLQLDTLQDAKENEEQVKRMRHDLKNHLEIIHSLCEEENIEELKKYTFQLNKEANLSGNGILTGNKIADMVLRSKMQLASEHNIQFSFTGTLESLDKMEAPDICGLLANAYDNAIEACISAPNPYIHTEVKTTQNYTVIRISNSVKDKVRIRNNSIATTKKEKYAHGYGISIMKRIALKYNGSCTLHYSEDEFSVKIVLLT